MSMNRNVSDRTGRGQAFLPDLSLSETRWRADPKADNRKSSHAAFRNFINTNCRSITHEMA
jgi:hypothetical protein